MTIAMLALAGFPATAGFFGKIYLIEAAVDNELRLARRGDRARLGDLAGVLPARDRRGLDALAVRGAGAARCGRRAAGDRRRLARGRRGRAAQRRDPARGAVVAVVCAAATVVFGIYPDPLLTSPVTRAPR